MNDVRIKVDAGNTVRVATPAPPAVSLEQFGIIRAAVSTNPRSGIFLYPYFKVWDDAVPPNLVEATWLCFHNPTDVDLGVRVRAKDLPGTSGDAWHSFALPAHGLKVVWTWLLISFVGGAAKYTEAQFVAEIWNADFTESLVDNILSAPVVADYMCFSMWPVSAYQEMLIRPPDFSTQPRPATNKLLTGQALAYMDESHGAGTEIYLMNITPHTGDYTNLHFDIKIYNTNGSLAAEKLNVVLGGGHVRKYDLATDFGVIAPTSTQYRVEVKYEGVLGEICAFSNTYSFAVPGSLEIQAAQGCVCFDWREEDLP